MIKISLIILCGLTILRVLKRQSAATRHWVLSVTLASAAAAPLVALTLPAWTLPWPSEPKGQVAIERSFTTGQASAPASPIAVPAAPIAQSGTSMTIGRVLTLLWLIGAAAAAAVLIVGLARLRWLGTRAVPVRSGPWFETGQDTARSLGIRRPVAILRSAHPTLLMTWGFWRPRIILPASAVDWSDERRRTVLAHELAHVQRGDWLAQLLAEFLRAACWFNPLAWIASRRLRLESEQACDDAVLALGVEAGAYARQLLELAREARLAGPSRSSVFPAPAMARPCSLERRIGAMLNDQVNRTRASRSVRTAASVPVLAIALLVGSFGAGAQTFSTFKGTVVDPAGMEVPGVSLSVANAASGATHQVKSGEAGRFEFVGLPPGEYQLTATLPGFRALTETVRIGGQDVQRNLALTLGTLSETIHVAGTRDGVDGPPAAPRGQRADHPSPSSVCKPGTSGGNVRPPIKLVSVNPVYPAYLRSQGVEGTVRLKATIGTDGNVRAVDVVDTPNQGLASAAIAAVREWEFDQTLLNCEPVEVEMRVTVTFQLQ
jgi:TonB family protein